MADQVKYTQKLKGEKVLIIGGSSGIGAAVAEASLESGCTVIISSSSDKKVQDKVAELQKLYPSASERVSGHACDLGDEANLEKNVKDLLDKTGGKLDHIIHTAGDRLASKALPEIDLEFVKKAGLVRFFSVLMLAKHAPNYVNSGSNSSIILTTGAVSEKPIPSWTVVNSYATGLQGMVRGMALDLKPLRVNLISPGYVDTALWDHLDPSTKQSHFEHAAKQLPTGRIATASDIAESYLYCMKDRNITGSMISTNGGSLII